MKTISETGLYLCWIGIELCTRDGTLIADPNLVHQIAKRESFFRNWAVLLWWMDLKQSTRDGWLIADPQYSLLAVLSHFLSRNRMGLLYRYLATFLSRDFFEIWIKFLFNITMSNNQEKRRMMFEMNSFKEKFFFHAHWTAILMTQNILHRD